MSATLPLDIAQYKQIVIMTGAGISVASGLPTYRGVGGLWETVDVASHATAAAMSEDPGKVWAFFSSVRRQIAQAQPNLGHLAIAHAEHRLRSDQSLTVLTQNVDGLHSLAGSTRVVELHGSLRQSRCTRCDFARDEDLASSPNGCPTCPSCAAPLRPAVTLFDEALPVDAVSGRWNVRHRVACLQFRARGRVRRSEDDLHQPRTDDATQSSFSRSHPRARRGGLAKFASRFVIGAAHQSVEVAL
ncbi:MAG: Silent information regulator protein Sir2 [Polyangiaceae bacterium]|nr:Silent information regulator protein Sir2 [Polyangiaceae bacterium]